MSYEIFYSSGVGPESTVDRQRNWIDFLNKHRAEGRQIYFFDPKWYSDESPEAKEARLYEEYESAGKPKLAVGSSAGATPTVLLGDRYGITMTTFAGYHDGEASIEQRYRDLYPAFPAFVKKSEEALRDLSLRRRLTTYVPWPYDTVIEREHVVVAGAVNKHIWFSHHGGAIGIALATILPRL